MLSSGNRHPNPSKTKARTSDPVTAMGNSCRPLIMFIINNFAAAHRHYYIASASELNPPKEQREKKWVLLLALICGYPSAINKIINNILQKNRIKRQDFLMGILFIISKINRFDKSITLQYIYLISFCAKCYETFVSPCCIQVKGNQRMDFEER